MDNFSLQLTTEWLGRHCIHLENVGSTNDYLSQNASMLPHGTVVIADRQHAGKGRLGREWLDNHKNSSVFMSFLLKDVSPQTSSVLPLICGLCVSQVLSELCTAPFDIKWPNDIVFDNKKICGILCEGATDSDRIQVIAGIGINLTQRAEDFASSLPHAASVLMMTGRRLEPKDVAQRILNLLEPLYRESQTDGFHAIVREYRAQCITLGKAVQIFSQGQTQKGTAIDIDENGNLVIHTDDGIKIVRSGEVSVRGLYDYI